MQRAPACHRTLACMEDLTPVTCTECCCQTTSTHCRQLPDEAIQLVDRVTFEWLGCGCISCDIDPAVLHQGGAVHGVGAGPGHWQQADSIWCRQVYAAGYALVVGCKGGVVACGHTRGVCREGSVLRSIPCAGFRLHASFVRQPHAIQTQSSASFCNLRLPVNARQAAVSRACLRC